MSRKDPYRKELVRQYKAQQAQLDAIRNAEFRDQMARFDEREAEHVRATGVAGTGCLFVIVGAVAGWFLAAAIGITPWLTVPAGIAIGGIFTGILKARKEAAWRRDNEY